MNFNSHLQQLSDNVQQSGNGLTAEDIAHLSNYPSLGKLFDGEAGELKTLKAKLEGTFQDFERVILRGSKDDAERAKSAAGAVKTVLEFLATLEKVRDEGKNV